MVMKVAIGAAAFVHSEVERVELFSACIWSGGALARKPPTCSEHNPRTARASSRKR